MTKDPEIWSQVIILLQVYLLHKMLETQEKEGDDNPTPFGKLLFIFPSSRKPLHTIFQ